MPVSLSPLERWPPSSYEVYLFHRGPLDAASTRLLGQLKHPSACTNLTLTLADVSGKLPGPLDRIWRQAGQPDSLPRLVVFFPDEDDNASPVWSAPLDDPSVRRLLDSPVRRRVVSLLSGGESVVWLLLTSGDAKADDDAARMLQRELAQLQDVLKLPDQAGADPELRSDVPLRISFPVVKLPRDQAEKAFLVRALLDSEEGLAKVAGPIVFPIFGRGRALMALHGEQLAPTHVERWASFLCGACSCRVKEANPGVDLLITADWDELLQTSEEKWITPTAPPIPPGRPARVEKLDPHRCHCWLWGSLSAAGVVAGMAGALRLRSRFVRKGNSRSTQ
jgi:hypothetical protein